MTKTPKERGASADAIVSTMPAARPRKAQDVTPNVLLQMALNQGADLDRLERLMNLQQRWEEAQARKAFNEAMSAFKASPPTIVKNKHVKFTTSKGTTEYMHASHDEVVSKITAALAPHGLSHTWQVEQAPGLVKVTCTLAHVLGHSESVTMQAAPDETGSKNAIQAVASTVLYLQRYTLLAITGLSTSETGAADTDGRPAAPQSPKPEGFDAWYADLVAAADNGSGTLEKVWQAGTTVMRAWVTIYLLNEWSDLKAKAARAAA